MRARQHTTAHARAAAHAPTDRLSQHLVQGDAKGVGVAGTAVGGAADGAQQLGRHVWQRPHHKLLEEAPRRPRLHDNVRSDQLLGLGGIEVGEHGAAAGLGDEDIVRLHVAMEHAARVQMRERTRHVGAHCQPCSRGERAARGVQHAEEASALEDG